MHREPRSFHKSTKPRFVNVCVWLFCKVNTLKCFYLLLDPSSSFLRGTDGRRVGGRRGRFGRPARGFGQPGMRGGGRPVVWPSQPWPARATPGPWARPAEAAGGPAAAAGNAGGGVLCREQGGEGERGREGSEKLGRPLWRALRYGRRQAHASMEWGKLSHGCHAHGHASPIEAIRRTGGVRRSVRRGARFWARSGPNQLLGQKRSLLYTACSTFLI